MPSIYYLREFYAGGYYHIYNRGAHQKLIFHDHKDYQTFTDILRHYLLSPLGSPPSIIFRDAHAKYRRHKMDKVPNLVHLPYRLIAYCLMPNHFHLMLEQVDEEIPISNLMRRLSVTYAMYYNSRYHHSGTILQGKYKNVRLETEVQWLYLTKYIHRNPLHNQESSTLCHKILSHYPYSSYPHYLGLKKENWIYSDDILGRYQNRAFDHYQDFVEDSEPGPIEHFTLDSDELQ